MALSPTKSLTFKDFTGKPGEKANCGDCAERRVNLPPPLPAIDDDFDWLVRDYDSFRLFMMEELAQRFPERRRWTPADIEVVIVELLAGALDRQSHALDDIYGEHFLATARRPESVRRLLKLIGYDALDHTTDAAFDRLPPLPDGTLETREIQYGRLEQLWRLDPGLMERARADGPRRIGEQERMVTLDDHTTRLELHPLVERARAQLVWTGAWNTILVSVLLTGAESLDAPLQDDNKAPSPGGGPNGITDLLWQAIVAHHDANNLPLPPVSEDLTARQILLIPVERFRMIGAEAFLEQAREAPITFWLSVKARDGYFRSELHDSLAQEFSSDAGGLFEPGNLGFGENVYASNIIEAAMRVDGIETGCLNRFKRLGNDYADETDSGVIAIAPDEVAICQNAPGDPARGTFELTILGGETG